MKTIKMMSDEAKETARRLMNNRRSQARKMAKLVRSQIDKQSVKTFHRTQHQAKKRVTGKITHAKRRSASERAVIAAKIISGQSLY